MTCGLGCAKVALSGEQQRLYGELVVPAYNMEGTAVSSTPPCRGGFKSLAASSSFPNRTCAYAVKVFVDGILNCEVDMERIIVGPENVSDHRTVGWAMMTVV